MSKRAMTSEHAGRARLALALILLLLPALGGCLTTAEVRDQIDASNRALVAAQGDALLLQDGKDWEETVARIDAFIEAHPDDPDTTAPLRLRQAMILAAKKQDALARAAFARVDASHLYTERDKALLAVSGHLVWWYRVQGTDFDSLKPAEEAHGALVLKAKTLTINTDARALLEDMIALLGSEIARQSSNPVKVRSYLHDGLDRYAKRFSEAEQKVLATPDLALPAEPAGLSMRRRLAIFRMPFFFERYKTVAADNGMMDIVWDPPWVRPYMK